MRPIELVELIDKEKPKLLAGIEAQRAARIIREALTMLGKQIESVEEGAVGIPGFGSFRVKQVQRKKDGETVRRVIFRTAKRKQSVEE
jgi:nucleoid DNA-binding protein